MKTLSFLPHRLRHGLFSAILLAPAFLLAGESVSFVLHEDDGIRRFGYPVRLLLPEGVRLGRDAPFRLLDGDTPVRAQLRTDTGSGAPRYWLDFSTSLGPHEFRVHRFEYGAGVPPGPARADGLSLVETAKTYEIANRQYLTWVVPKELRGVVRSLRAQEEIEYVRPGAEGLFIRDRDGREHSFSESGASGLTSRIVRSGPFAIGLEFDKLEAAASLANVSSKVSLDFVVSKSWVEVDWVVDDPTNRVSALGVKLSLALASPDGRERTLVDFGATSLVYVSLGVGEVAELLGEPKHRADRPQYVWEVLRGTGGQLESLVTAPNRSGADSRPEGWVHLMDRRKCLAAAVDRFAERTRDRIRVSADGTLTIWREWGHGDEQAQAMKSLRIWFHFVPFPPQVTAATSPQSMQSPLRVEFTEAGGDTK